VLIAARVCGTGRAATRCWSLPALRPSPVWPGRMAWPISG